MPVQSGAGGTEAGGFDPSKAAKIGKGKGKGLGGLWQQATDALGKIGQKPGSNQPQVPAGPAHSAEPLTPAQSAAEETFDPFADDPNAPPRPEAPGEAQERRIRETIDGILALGQQAESSGQPAAESQVGELPDWLSSPEIGAGGQPPESPTDTRQAQPLSLADAEEMPYWMKDLVPNPSATPARAPAAAATSGSDAHAASEGIGMISRHGDKLASEPVRGAGASAAPAPAAIQTDSRAADQAGARKDEVFVPKVYNTDDLDIPAFLRRRKGDPADLDSDANAAAEPAANVTPPRTEGGPAALVQGQEARPDWLSAAASEPARPVLEGPASTSGDALRNWREIAVNNAGLTSNVEHVLSRMLDRGKYPNREAAIRAIYDTVQVHGFSSLEPAARQAIAEQIYDAYQKEKNAQPEHIPTPRAEPLQTVRAPAESNVAATADPAATGEASGTGVWKNRLAQPWSADNRLGTPAAAPPPAPPAEPSAQGLADPTFDDLGLDASLFTPPAAAPPPAAPAPAEPSAPATADPTFENLGLDPDLFTPPAAALTAVPAPAPEPSASEPQPAPPPAEPGAKPAFDISALSAASDSQKQPPGPDAAGAEALASTPTDVAPTAAADRGKTTSDTEAWFTEKRAAKAAALAGEALTSDAKASSAPAPEAASRVTYESLVTQYGLPERSAETVRKIIETSDPDDKKGVLGKVSAIAEAVGVLPEGKTPEMIAGELYESLRQQPPTTEPEKPQVPKEKKPKKYRKGTLPFSDQLTDLSFTPDELADIRAQLKFASGATLRPEGTKGALKSEEDVKQLQLNFIQSRLQTKFHIVLSASEKGASVKGYNLNEVTQAVYDAFKREEAQYLQGNPQVAWLYGKIKDLKAANEANPRLEVSLVAAQRAQAYSDTEQFKEARAVLQKMEDSGALKGGVVEKVKKADLDFRGISATYYDIEVRDAGVEYLQYVAKIMAGSSGDKLVPPQIIHSIHAHQRSEAFRQFREIATHPKKGSMITLSADGRYYIYAKDGRPVTLDTINAVIGMNENGVVENPQALVNGAAEVILDEVTKVTMLNDSIRNGEEAVGKVQTDHEKTIDALRTSKIKGVREVCESALSEAGSQVSLLQREIDAKQKEIEAIKASPEASDQVTESVRKSRQVTMSQLDAQLATLNVNLKREQAGLDALKEQTERIIQGTVKGEVEPEMDAMRASADEDVYVLKAQLLRQGPERIQLYHDGVLATALQEGTTAMGELKKWQSLLTRQGREEVVDKVAQTLLQNQSQLDSFQARRSFLQGLAGKKKGDFPSELASLKPAERTKKINEEIQLLTTEIDRLDGERRDNYTRSYNALIPLEAVFNTRPQSKVGEIYQFAVLGGEAMVPTGDGTTRERVVKPGLKQLARYDELQGEIDARVKELREEAGMQLATETPAPVQAPTPNQQITEPLVGTSLQPAPQQQPAPQPAEAAAGS